MGCCFGSGDSEARAGNELGAATPAGTSLAARLLPGGRRSRGPSELELAAAAAGVDPEVLSNLRRLGLEQHASACARCGIVKLSDLVQKSGHMPKKDAAAMQYLRNFPDEMTDLEKWEFMQSWRPGGRRPPPAQLVAQAQRQQQQQRQERHADPEEDDSEGSFAGEEVEEKAEEGHNVWRPLHRAAWEGLANELRNLLAHDAALADIDQQGPDGKTALHLAAGHGRASCVAILLERGANAKLTDKKGRTAAQFAAQYRQRTISELLREHEKSPGETANATARLYLMEGLQTVDSAEEGSLDVSRLSLHVLRSELTSLRAEQQRLRMQMSSDGALERRKRLLSLRKQISALERGLQEREAKERAAARSGPQGAGGVAVPGVAQVDSDQED